MTSETPLQPASAVAAVPQQATMMALTVAIKRTLSAVQAETQVLRSGEHGSLKTFEHRKSQALLDLARARASLPSQLQDEETSDLLQDLKEALADNMQLLAHHMKAVQEITELLAQSMLDADSDGTYSRRFPGTDS